jgi:hypothetical protein
MSYCRFYNTVSDLQDCLDHIECALSEEENDKRLVLIKICKGIAARFADYDEKDFGTDEDGDCCTID